MFCDASCHASGEHLCFIASRRLLHAVSNELLAQKEQMDYEAKRKIHVQSLSKTAKLDPNIGFVQNFELKADYGLVNCQIHEAAPNMPHHPTVVTRTTSITELLLIERLLMPINAINYFRPIHQPKGIDLPVQKEKVNEKSPNKRK